MIELHRILNATIQDFQTAKRLDDWTFDAFEYLSKKIGHKNPSTLRKMCEPRESRNGAKLGIEDAIIIISETNDYRLLQYVREKLKELRVTKTHQLTLFSEPLRSMEDLS